MTLTIITINRNNAAGLEKTMLSVASQTRKDIEYVVVDGASTDGSVDMIRRLEKDFAGRLKWISEPDGGIYNAMNKGIGMASGDYLQFLNSGDRLASEDVTEKMFQALEDNGFPTILYGYLLKDMPDGHILRDRCFAGQDITFQLFYAGALNHSSSYILRNLFDIYGLYDETLKVVSDWKWFLKAVIFEGEKPVYSDIDVTIFDMTGISQTNKELEKAERKQVLDGLLPPAILADYARWSLPIEKMKRIQRHTWAYKLVWFLERCLFKMERHLNMKRDWES